MNKGHSPNSMILGGICGISGTTMYVLASFLSVNHTILYAIAISWPILSIIFVYSIYKYVALEHQTTANQLSFLFAALGFTIVACMISIQLAVKWGIDEYLIGLPEKEELVSLFRQNIRLVDQGLDVAWDLFIGTSLIFLFAAIKGHYRFRFYWAIPSVILGSLLIIFNVITFPAPPNTKGLLDVGPLVGLYIIALSARLWWLGLRLKKSQKNSE